MLRLTVDWHSFFGPPRFNSSVRSGLNDSERMVGNPEVILGPLGGGTWTCSRVIGDVKRSFTLTVSALVRSLPSQRQRPPRKRRILSFMRATKKFLFASVLFSSLVSLLAACHSDRPESFYASLADVRKAEASAQSWIPDDILPASSRTIHVVGDLSPSKEWCAFEFLPTDSQNLLNSNRPSIFDNDG